MGFSIIYDLASLKRAGFLYFNFFLTFFCHSRIIL